MACPHKATCSVLKRLARLPWAFSTQNRKGRLSLLTCRHHITADRLARCDEIPSEARNVFLGGLGSPGDGAW